MTNTTANIDQKSTRLARDGRMLTTPFELLGTAETDEHGVSSTIYFEVITSHYASRRMYGGSIMRCTRTVEGGIESKLYRHLMTGPKCPVTGKVTIAARFNASKLAALHAEQVAQLLNCPDDLTAVIAWASTERD